MDIPVKYDWMVTFRKWLDRFTIYIPLPNINPDIVSVLSIFTMATAFMYPINDWWIFLFVFISMILDWFDGVIARKFNRVSRRGYWVDMICDRIGEIILAIYSPLLWLPLFLLNLLLTFINIKTKVHFVLPIRVTFLIFLIFKIAGIDFGWI